MVTRKDELSLRKIRRRAAEYGYARFQWHTCGYARNHGIIACRGSSHKGMHATRIRETKHNCDNGHLAFVMLGRYVVHTSYFDSYDTLLHHGIICITKQKPVINLIRTEDSYTFDRMDHLRLEEALFRVPSLKDHGIDIESNNW
eukprot:gb/GECG01012109.1/.p1 GENE.gb/GECG01012109.1/~~gb/GECG01012109.1/.p1  ORF type:complete len:144 (+),score=7.52 gb/GECG01012109.1/:1-432(+)